MSASVSADDLRRARYLAFGTTSGPYIEWQLAQFDGFLGSRIIEVGCGVGSVAQQLLPRDLYVGLDVVEPVLKEARERFAEVGRVEFRLLDISQASESEISELNAFQFDTVVSINVLEHIEDDRAALARFAEVLHPGGVLALLVPAHPMLYGDYDRLDGHFRRYRARELRAKMESAGFRVTRLRHFNAVGAIGWWVQYKLLRRAEHAAGHLDSMALLSPFLRRAEAVLPPPFGLSLVAIGELAR